MYVHVCQASQIILILVVTTGPMATEATGTDSQSVEHEATHQWVKRVHKFNGPTINYCRSIEFVQVYSDYLNKLADGLKAFSVKQNLAGKRYTQGCTCKNTLRQSVHMKMYVAQLGISYVRRSGQSTPP